MYSLLQHFASTNLYIEAQTFLLPRHPNTNELIRNIPNTVENVLMKTETVDETSPSESVKPVEAYE